MIWSRRPLRSTTASKGRNSTDDLRVSSRRWLFRSRCPCHCGKAVDVEERTRYSKRGDRGMGFALQELEKRNMATVRLPLAMFLRPFSLPTRRRPITAAGEVPTSSARRSTRRTFSLRRRRVQNSDSSSDLFEIRSFSAQMTPPWSPNAPPWAAAEGPRGIGGVRRSVARPSTTVTETAAFIGLHL
ncbi:unnamed protein product [Spirodela intermedia]|uniref:Uncharacterized protein n=1 Tax=Spirodela intermedia TaxID=51605 RepID=A0A7I8JIE5_SPIIN|nr:unnamed protein product [Spirodela intermedia]CAA6669192.1 unnamed protein product [Spirodela intermedia]